MRGPSLLLLAVVTCRSLLVGRCTVNSPVPAISGEGALLFASPHISSSAGIRWCRIRLAIDKSSSILSPGISHENTQLWRTSAGAAMWRRTAVGRQPAGGRVLMLRSASSEWGGVGDMPSPGVDGAPKSSISGRAKIVPAQSNRDVTSKPRGRGKRTTLSDIMARKHENGALSEGLDALQDLIGRGKSVNAKSFTMLLSICTEQIRRGYASLDDARRLMDKCIECGVQLDTFLFNGLMSACAKAASRGHATLTDGSRVLQDMRSAGCSPDIVTFNSLMDICAKAAGQTKSEDGGIPITTMTGYSVLKLIADEGLHPNVVTFSSLMQLCAKCSARGRASVQDGLQVLDRARMANVKLNVRVFNSLMDVVAKSARHGQADNLDGLAVLKRLRDEGLKPDTTTFNCLLEVSVHCAFRGKATLSDGLKVIQAMRAEDVPRDVITYNCLLGLLAKETYSRGSARVAEGHGIVAVMKADGVRPDLQTYSTLIDICAKATEHGVADLSDADKVLETMKEEGILDLDKVICNSYLNCAKADGSSAALVAAEKILDIMPMEQRDSFTYSCIIGLLGRTSDFRRAREMFEEARMNLPRLTVYVYNAAMSVHSQQGNYGEVLELWQRMRSEHIKEDAVTLLHIKVAQDAQDAPW